MSLTSIGSFFDRRREFREDLEEGAAVLDGGGPDGGGPGGGVLRLVNWSRTGFLAFSRDWSAPPGTRFAAALALTAAGRHFHFRCEAEVVRMDPAQGAVAARFVHLEPAARCAIDRHFDPAAALAGSAYAGSGRSASGDGEGAGTGAGNGAGGGDLPALPTAPEAPVFASLHALDPAGLAAAADCLAAVKAAFARRFHPDAAVPDAEQGMGDRAARTRLFQEFWADLDAMERGLKALRDTGRPVS